MRSCARRSREAAFNVFAIIDHQAAARRVEVDMQPTVVPIHGHPRAGTPLILAAPDFGLELPLKALVREDTSNKVFMTSNSSSNFEGSHGLPSGMAAKLASADKVVAEAVALAPW